MAIANTGKADVEIIAGGKTSSGTPKGVYHVVVTETGVDQSEGDPKATPPKPPRGCIVLTLNVTKKDKLNVSKQGKKLLQDRTYFGAKGDDEDKFAMMQGMAKNKLYAGFDLPWPKDGKKVDPRIFQNKEAFIWVAAGSKPDDKGEFRTQVQAIATTEDKLPKKAKEWLAAARAGKLPKSDEADGEVEAESETDTAPAKPTRR